MCRLFHGYSSSQFSVIEKLWLIINRSYFYYCIFTQSSCYYGTDKYCVWARRSGTDRRWSVSKCWKVTPALCYVYSTTKTTSSQHLATPLLGLHCTRVISAAVWL